MTLPEQEQATETCKPLSSTQPSQKQGHAVLGVLIYNPLVCEAKLWEILPNGKLYPSKSQNQLKSLPEAVVSARTAQS